MVVCCVFFSDEMLRIQEAELERQREMERMRQLGRLARMHRTRCQLLYRGIRPWSRLMADRRTQMAKAAMWYEDVLEEKAWSLWRYYVAMSRKERQRRRERMVRGAVVIG